MTSEPAAILASATHLMESRHTGRQYRITVSLPLGYSKGPDEGWPFHDTPDRFPVVYVLDGNWYAGMVTGMIRPMSWCGSTTDAIVIGIGYPEAQDPVEAFRTSFVRRDFDLTPVPDAEVAKSMEQSHKRPVPNGDAGNFLKFIQYELIPFIEQGYRADPLKRILVGHSYGGLFAIFSLFEAPDLFKTLIIGSPTLVYGNRVMFEREAAFAKERKTLPVNIYLFAGDQEEGLTDTTATDTLRMAVQLQGRGYDGLTLVRQVFTDMGHCDVVGAGYAAGLKFALKK